MLSTSSSSTPLEKRMAPADLGTDSAIAPSKTLPSPVGQDMAAFVLDLQTRIVARLEDIETQAQGAPVQFLRDAWTRDEGGHGLSCVLQGGSVFEKGGVNVSIIQSPCPPPMLAQMRARLSSIVELKESTPYDMSVAGISMVLHPHNPHAPTVHLNYRYFELLEPSNSTPVAWWFGGGCDLTPSYLYDEDCIHFHSTLKKTCDKHDPEYYPKFKKWCDSYFSNTHRGGESRGIGGIFFDDLDSKDPRELMAFVQDCGNSFLESYIPILLKRKDQEFSLEEKEWQQIRRGRYVEFNLVHDRGTKFGLATPGVRIESVLMSLPLTARWEYKHVPLKDSREERLLNILKNPQDWV